MYDSFVTRCIFLLSSLALLGGCATPKAVDYLSIGNRIQFEQLSNQFDEPFTKSGEMRVLVYASSMDAKDKLQTVLSKIPKKCFDEGRLVYVANVSGMPSLITSFVAIPKMKEWPYPVWLDKTGEATERLPIHEEMVSVVEVEDGRLKNVSFIGATPTLLDMLNRLCSTDYAVLKIK